MASPILITGVGKRLGLALATHCLEKGQPIIGTYRTPTKGIEALFDAGATLYQCDFYQPEQVQLLIDRIKTDFKALRAVVHNASDWDKEAGNNDLPDLFQKMICIHAAVPYQLNFALHDLLTFSAAPDELGTRDIIHVTDFVAATGSGKHIAYAASKAALENLSLSFAKKYAPIIKVNSIAPALMLFNPSDSESYRERTVQKALIPKEGGEKEFIDTVNYLLESRYITGRTVHLDGGRHLK
jgi:dihydromonapterin reductase/dihydrofolate reductase